MDVVDGASGHHRMDAAGVVVNHPSQRAVIVSSRIGAEGKLVSARLLAQMVEHHAGLDAGGFGCGIQIQDVAHVFGDVEEDGEVDGLTGHPGAAAAQHDGRVETAAALDRRRHVTGVARDHHPDRHLPVIAGGGGVHGAIGGVEADFPAHVAAQVPGESFDIDARRKPRRTG
jgi:hypothetical protein